MVLHGTVHGVEFRPFVYRLATELGLTGWVHNTAHGVYLEVEGDCEQLQDFLRRLGADKPPHIRIQQCKMAYLVPIGSTAFVIQESYAVRRHSGHRRPASNHQLRRAGGHGIARPSQEPGDGSHTQAGPAPPGKVVWPC